MSHEIPTPDEYFALMDTAPRDGRGACYSCGFLSIRLHVPGEPIIEANEYRRQSGDLWHGLAETTTGFPHCFVYATSHINELHDDFSSERRYYGVRRIILQDRQCKSWFQYVPGRSPKEHLERLEVLQLEQARQAHDLKLAEMQREVQDKGVEISRALLDAQQANAAAQEANAKSSDQTAQLALRIALVSLAVALLAAMAELGSFALQLLNAASATPSP